MDRSYHNAVKAVTGMSMPGGAQAVERALGILEFVASMPAPVTVQEIAKGMDLHRNTAYRLARTLAARDYLEVENGAYTLGPRLAALGQSVGRLNFLVRACDPILQEVSDATGEVVNLGIRRGDQVFYLGRWETTTQHAGVYVRMGQQAPLYASALGKVLLGAMAPEARAAYYRRCPFTPYTAHTVTRAEDLDELVRRALDRGYAEDLEELSEGVRCVAVPVVSDGVVMAAISIALPALRLTEESRAQFVVHLTKAASSVSRALDLPDPSWARAL